MGSGVRSMSHGSPPLSDGSDAVKSYSRPVSEFGVLHNMYILSSQILYLRKVWLIVKGKLAHKVSYNFTDLILFRSYIYEWH